MTYPNFYQSFFEIKYCLIFGSLKYYSYLCNVKQLKHHTMKLLDKHDDVTCLENCQWVVTSSNVTIGIAHHKTKLITPCHGYWGDQRLKKLACEMGYTYSTSPSK